MEDFKESIKIANVKNNLNKLSIRAIILEIIPLKVRKSQEDYFLMKIADETAKINCTLFDSRASLLKTGDIIFMTGCHTKRFKSHLTVYKYPEGNLLKIGEFCMEFSDKIDMSSPSLDKEDISKEQESIKKPENSFVDPEYVKNNNATIHGPNCFPRKDFPLAFNNRLRNWKIPISSTSHSIRKNRIPLAKKP